MANGGSEMNAEPPDASLPWVWCDFNACGWSGQAGDTCYYVLDRRTLDGLHPAEGMRVFVFDYEGAGEMVGCAGRLEWHNGDWRVRPDEWTNWYRGRV
jgi:hypothetical protein